MYVRKGLPVCGRLRISCMFALWRREWRLFQQKTLVMGDRNRGFMRKDRKDMYKKAVSVLILCNMIFLSGFLCVFGVGQTKSGAEERAACEKEEGVESRTLGIAQQAVSGQRVVDFCVLERSSQSLEEEDLEALLRIVESEAGNEDEEGKLLVANVVLNRVRNERFPSTVTEVVFQQEHGVSQFSPVSNGRYYQVEISEETFEAVGRALQGEDISEGALFFASRKYADSAKMKWFDENLTFVLEHGGHEFFK